MDKQRYEYKVCISEEIDDIDLVNKMAKEGWRLVGAISGRGYLDSAEFDGTHYYFERELSDIVQTWNRLDREQKEIVTAMMRSIVRVSARKHKLPIEGKLKETEEQDQKLLASVETAWARKFLIE